MASPPGFPGRTGSTKSIVAIPIPLVSQCKACTSGEGIATAPREGDDGIAWEILVHQEGSDVVAGAEQDRRVVEVAALR